MIWRPIPVDFLRSLKIHFSIRVVFAVRSLRQIAIVALALSLGLPVWAAKPTTHRSAATGHLKSGKKKTGKGSRAGKARTGSRAGNTGRQKGQQGIQAERATEIQQALIREHYLSGEPSGKWDAPTIAAMQRYQSDNGWQTKLAPDSRALKKLGLGPDYSNAINARTGSFNDPPPISSIPRTQATGFAAAAGVNR